MLDLRNIVGFEWDKGNIEKSYKKHGIRPRDTEEVFLDKDLQIERDIKHQAEEERYIAIGRTLESEILFIIFTMRNNRIRIISGRRSNRKERRLYEESIEKNTKI